jgi:hypothetical protein
VVEASRYRTVPSGSSNSSLSETRYRRRADLRGPRNHIHDGYSRRRISKKRGRRPRPYVPGFQWGIWGWSSVRRRSAAEARATWDIMSTMSLVSKRSRSRGEEAGPPETARVQLMLMKESRRDFAGYGFGSRMSTVPCAMQTSRPSFSMLMRTTAVVRVRDTISASTAATPWLTGAR